MSKATKIHRSAVTGQFVTQKETEKHPKTTVTETIKKPQKSSKKNSLH
jgi:hypothetical protein